MYALVPRRMCRQKMCRLAGRLGHRSHSACQKEDCVDRGLQHRTDHRVLKQKQERRDDHPSRENRTMAVW